MRHFEISYSVLTPKKAGVCPEFSWKNQQKRTWKTIEECTLKRICKKPNNNGETWEKHNRLNVGRIALERLVGALMNCSLLQSRGGGGEGEPKWD